MIPSALDLGHTVRPRMGRRATVAAPLDSPVAEPVWEQAWLVVNRERAALSEALAELRTLERQTQKAGPSPQQAAELRRLRSQVSSLHTTLARAGVTLVEARKQGTPGAPDA
ncbi:MAG: hypothetical protein AVDCRST_MAG77-5526 [uncultured Chloroflexi bacterium]|uniref:Uncharacterized protein n=1 Tax=uncultured Chloroflexota bacterium TaxID=166587 RepID=A0A6J4KA77_9CHLR|nr:MAG: hypothetical protein AVDCRST_MAG77-5526 [uncultured Chloroflexota bacterium]